MSKAAELARNEAELEELRDRLAELEQADLEETADEREQLRARIAELEHEPTPPAPAEPAPELEREWPAEPTEEMFAQVRELNAAHQQAVRDIMGPFVEGLEECATCFGVGLAPPTPAGPTYQHDPNKQTCSVCAGEGQLETGSKREGYILENCANCNGKGWVGPDNLNAVQAAAAAVASVGAPAESAPAPGTPGETPAPANEDPRVAELRALGYVVVKT